MQKRIGYLRVSTDDQNTDRQRDGLQAHCDELFIEQGVSATAKSRPVFEKILSELQAGDMLVVWDLDRAFRSTIDAIMVADSLRERGVHFHIVNLSVDTSTPAGMLVYTVMAAQAQFERANLAQRTKEGMAAARKRGKQLGRPKAMTRAQIQQARKMRASGAIHADIAHVFNVDKRTVAKYLKLEEQRLQQLESNEHA